MTSNPGRPSDQLRLPGARQAISRADAIRVWDAALCAETDPELFFPEAGRTVQSQLARQICGRCEVTALCLATFGPLLTHGVVGGTTGPATPPSTAFRWGGGGVIYLLHFDRPYRHAWHYLGSTDDGHLAERFTAHAIGRGARLTHVVAKAGIGCQLARTWPGGRARERQLKRQGGASRRCPLCGVHPRTPQPLDSTRRST